MRLARCLIAKLSLLVLVTLTACDSAIDSSANTAAYPNDDRLRLNHIQIMGTHNSYHPYPAQEPMATVIREQYPFYPTITGDYRHKPLYQQLDELGVRHLAGC